MFIEWLCFPLLQTSLPLNVPIKVSSLSACWLAILKIVYSFPFFFFYNPDNVSRWEFVVLSSTVICWCCSTRSSAADWSTSPGGRWWRRWGRPQIETWRSLPLRIPPARKIRRIYKYLHISLGVSFHNPFWRNELNYLFIYLFFKIHFLRLEGLQSHPSINKSHQIGSNIHNGNPSQGGLSWKDEAEESRGP